MIRNPVRFYGSSVYFMDKEFNRKMYATSQNDYGIQYDAKEQRPKLFVYTLTHLQLHTQHFI